MEKDVSWKEYFRDDERYADVINGIGFGGRQLVVGENLEEADTQTIFGGLYGGRIGIPVKGRRKLTKKIRTRDMVRKVAFGVSFAIVGLENQELVDYALPLRCMVYDVGEYEKQVGKIRKNLRKQNGLRAGEYLYGFKKDSRLYPVVTFVLYGGEKPWDGPERLHEMLDMDGLPEEMRELVADYPLHLVDIRRLKDTGVFKTDVKQVFDFIRCSGDKKELFKLVQTDESFQSMEEDAYELATNYAGAEELIQVKEEYRKGGKIDMCKALKELLADERMEGRTEGRTEGQKELVLRMYLDGSLNVQKACVYLECTQEEFMGYVKAMEK